MSVPKKRCAICMGPPGHDPDGTGLCVYCHGGLLWFAKHPGRIDRAIAYLKSKAGQAVVRKGK